MMKTLFVWDLNETIETGSEYSDMIAINNLLEELGSKKRLTKEELKGMPASLGAKLRIVIKGAGIAYSEQIRKKVIEHRIKVGLEYSKPVPGAEEALAEVKKHGDDNIVVTVAPKDVANEMLEKIGLRQYIDEVYSASEERNKKFPERHGDVENDAPKWKAFCVDKHSRKEHYGRKIFTGDRPEDAEAGNLCGATAFLIGKESTADFITKGLTGSVYVVSSPLDAVRIAYAIQ